MRVSELRASRSGASGATERRARAARYLWWKAVRHADPYTEAGRLTVLRTKVFLLHQHGVGIRRGHLAPRTRRCRDIVT